MPQPPLSPPVLPTPAERSLADPFRMEVELHGRQWVVQCADLASLEAAHEGWQGLQPEDDPARARWLETQVAAGQAWPVPLRRTARGSWTVRTGGRGAVATAS